MQEAVRSCSSLRELRRETRSSVGAQGQAPSLLGFKWQAEYETVAEGYISSASVLSLVAAAAAQADGGWL